MEPEIASCSTTLTPNKAATPAANGVEEECEVVDFKNKGKAIQLGDDDEQLEGSGSNCYDTTNNDESYPDSSPLSNSLLDPDSLIYEEDDDYFGHMEDELEEEDAAADDYVSEYQALFDAMEKDIPAGVEVTVDWLPISETAKSSRSGKCSRDEHGMKPEAPSSSSKKATMGSGIQSTPFAQPWNALPHNSKGVIPNSAYALPLKHSANPLEPQTPDTVMGEAPVLAPASSGLVLPAPNHPPWYKGHKVYPAARPRVEEVISAQSSSRIKRNIEDYLGKYLFSKKFDTVEDLGDHESAAQGTTSKQNSKAWTKRIQEEWRILENDMPDRKTRKINPEMMNMKVLSSSLSSHCTCGHWYVRHGTCLSCKKKLPSLITNRPFDYLFLGLRLSQEAVSFTKRLTTLISLHTDKKLHLVLDLDHTLVHSVKVSSLSRGEKYLMEGEKPPCFKLYQDRIIKVRPFVKDFLEEANNLFNMYVYTKGALGYAKEIARMIDPNKTYFGDRVITRRECPDTKTLDLVLADERGIVIVDDSVDVWPHHKRNLLHITRYNYFKHKNFHRVWKPSYAESKGDESQSSGALANLLRYLKEIHNAFFSCVVQEELDTKDVRLLIKGPFKPIGC